MNGDLLLTAQGDSVGNVFNGLIGAVVSSGSIGALASVAIMTVTAVWCIVQQVMFRFGRAFSPISRVAVSLFILSTPAYALILLHPESIVPVREGLAMTFCFTTVTVVVGCWSVYANLLSARIDRLHAGER